MVLERLSWLVTGPSNASFCLLMVARGGPYGPTGKLTLLRNPVVGLVLQEGDAEKFPHALVSKAWIFFFQSANRDHVSEPQRMKATRDLQSLNLLAKLMLLRLPDDETDIAAL